jgi:flagellar FliJ protein
VRKFRFRLESVLRYRVVIEELKERDLMAVRVRKMAAERQLKVLQNEIHRIRSEWVTADPVRREWSEIYQTRVLDAVAAQELTIEMIEREEEVALKAYVEARRGREIAERLRSKDLAEYRLELEREQQRELDEWTVLRSARHS